MNDIEKAKLEEANKLIFVKQYTEAEKIFLELISSPIRHGTLIVHLRAIELAAKLGRLEVIKRLYVNEQRMISSSELVDICLAFVEQNSEDVSLPAVLAKFSDIVKHSGPSAAAYYGMGFSLEAQGSYDRALYNYEQSIAIDPSWYPSYFGLSQIFYHQGDDKKGDQYFFQYEQAAPYNVYGNFETHRKLCLDFVQQGRYLEAEAAVQALSDWWQENKGYCPPEIQIYEFLAKAKIGATQGDSHQHETNLQRARILAKQMLMDQVKNENVLYFVARLFEEHDDAATAYDFFKHILKHAGNNPVVVQRIGGQFLSLGQYSHAKDLFEEAYDNFPDNPEIRFCRLVADLKLAKVNVEDYLIGKERLRQLIQNQGDRVELLALLHSLYAKFQNDAEVHHRLGEIYIKLANTERAARYFQKMYELDSKSRRCQLKYATFCMQHGDPEEAMQVLQKLVGHEHHLDREEQTEIGWLKAGYYYRKKDFQASQDQLKKTLKMDPWSITYLVQQAINLINLHKKSESSEEVKPDETLLKLLVANETELNWEEFDQVTQKAKTDQNLELAYVRRKIRFLYAAGEEQKLLDLIEAAGQFDGVVASYDFLRLLNTNFDSPWIYYALGVLYKDMWQLESACMWFDQLINYSGVSQKLMGKAYVELADCLVWRNSQIPKAIEYAKLAIDLGERSGHKTSLVLSHAFLRNGQVRDAQSQLDKIDEGEEPEARFLKGLVQYRNGARIAANQMWKPLLTHRSDSLRFHTIKQEILKFYFDGMPYLKAN